MSTADQAAHQAARRDIAEADLIEAEDALMRKIGYAIQYDPDRHPDAYSSLITLTLTALHNIDLDDDAICPCCKTTRDDLIGAHGVLREQWETLKQAQRDRDNIEDNGDEPLSPREG